jgi:hypothetical protein
MVAVKRVTGMITDELMTSNTWRYGNKSSVFARQMKFLPWGVIGGYEHDHEKTWSVADGALTLSDAHGVPSSTYKDVSRDGGLVLKGTFRDGAPLELAITEAFHRLATAAEGIDPVRRSSTPQRRNLVIVRAGAKTLRPSWPRDLPDNDRSWDLCVSSYGDRPSMDLADFHVHQPDRGKFKALHQLLHEASFAWSYEYIMLIDDDMMISWRSISMMFATMREFGLLIAQPALTHDSMKIHDVTLAQDGLRLRFTAFVEPMAPVFAREALRLALPAFGSTESGFGIDHLWRFMLGNPRDKLAIVDSVTATHTKPPFQGYSVTAAQQEERGLMAAYGHAARYNVYGHITA